MEFLSFVENHTVRMWLAQAIVLFFLIGGVTLLAVGAGLIANSAATLQWFGRMNRWVSMRSATKPLEVPRDTRSAVQKHRHWLGAVFVVGGAFAIYGLLTRFDVKAVVLMLGLDTLRPVVAASLVDGMRWVLVVGNLTGIAVGILLAFFPGRLVALEAAGSRWYSERQMTKGADKMNFKLDPWVAAYPRAAGWVIVFFALGLIGAFGLMLPRVL